MNKIPFLDLRRVNGELESEIKNAIIKVIESGWYILGKEVQRFESAMAEDLGEGFIIGCNSGTDALILSLRTAGVRPGDEVITVANTAIPTVTAIVTIGAVPVFVDIDPDTWLMDMTKVSNVLTEKTKAIIPVHLYGNMANILELRKILNNLGRSDVCIIEDCAQAQGAKMLDRYAGTLGDFGAYSFYPSKNIGALGDGGAVFTKNKDSCEKLQMFRNYGQRDRYNAQVQGGLNSRLDEIQAAVLTVKLPYLHKWNKYKEELMKIYREELSGLPITFQAPTDGCVPAWHLCVVALNDNLSRDEFQHRLNEVGVGTLVHYPYPIHTQAAFKKFAKDSLTNTENLARRIVSLPFNYAMTKDDIKEISTIIKKAFNKE